MRIASISFKLFFLVLLTVVKTRADSETCKQKEKHLALLEFAKKSISKAIDLHPSCGNDSKDLSTNSSECGAKAKISAHLDIAWNLIDAAKENYTTCGNVPADVTCQCDSRGSLGLECDYQNNCSCKPNVQGRDCNQCKEGFFNLEYRNPEGCDPCFCFGVTQQCSSSSYYRSQIAMRLEDLADPYNHNFQLTSRFRTRNITEGIIANPSQNEVSFTSFPREPEQTETLFWSLPAQFLGNKLASYGGKLKYTQQYLAGDGGDLLADADVEMTGNGTSVFYVNIPTLNPQEIRTFEIELRETNWQRVDSGGPTSATREDFMKVLANVEALLIRASFHNRMHQTLLRDAQMDTALPQSTGQSLATAVEQCVCPSGYIGLSCEECAPGYLRDASGPGLGRCTVCNCNGHSESCDATTKSCVRCQHNAVGESCERCADGFYGDATQGTPEDCKPCPCPLTTPLNQFSPTCFLDNDGQPTCNACRPGYVGRNCEKCASGYRGNPVQPGSRCEERNPPTVHLEPERQTIVQGSSGELRCIVGGIPKPTVSWSKVGADLSNRHRIEGDNLFISDVTVEDGGSYVCKAENRDGSAQASAIVEVERREVPAIELYPEATQTVIRGGSSSFECRVTAGIPTPTVEWVRADGSTFTSSTEILSGGVIRFNRVTEDEEGTYICIAENSVGRATAQAVLQIEVPKKSADCSEILENGDKKSGRYTIWPKHQSFNGKSLEVYCDMDSDGGGWTVLQRRGNFLRKVDFYRNWVDYKNGFGNISEEFWIGNDKIFALTNLADCTLRFDLENVRKEHRIEMYSSFRVEDENAGYMLHYGNHKGTTGRDSMSTTQNMQFSTKDKIYEKAGKYCHSQQQSGWWFSRYCGNCNPNGMNDAPGVQNGKSMWWGSWNNLECLLTIEMKIRTGYF